MNSSGVYKITNTITNDSYIGSSKDVNRRWAHHKCPSRWKKCPNSQLYLDFQKYGVDKFEFQILANVEPDQLKETEQKFIEKLQPTYNNYRAKGVDVERRKKQQKEYRQSDKYKKYDKEYKKEYNKKYHQTKKYKEYHKEYQKEYRKQLCFYNGKTLTLQALYFRFRRAGIENPIIEAKKYLLDK